MGCGYGAASLAALLIVVGGGRVGAQSGSPLGPGEVDGEAATWTTYGEADFTWRIQPLDGDLVTLDRFRGEVLFINLWASWCTPCVRELASIERLRARLADTDVRFLIVAAEGERPVRRFLRRYTYDLPIYLERTPVPASFGLRGLPTTWLVDRSGHLVLLRHGEAVWDTDEVEAFVRAVAREPRP
ncbi:MAG: TlpA disulfide reductase family protein [Gemmatimonadota bacterium]